MASLSETNHHPGALPALASTRIHADDPEWRLRAQKTFSFTNAPCGSSTSSAEHHHLAVFGLGGLLAEFFESFVQDSVLRFNLSEEES